MTRANGRRTPTNTYRLQITADFDLYAAARVLPHLHDLGVDWVYLSPLLTAEDASDHGYDVVAHEAVDASRGGPEGLAALSTEARRLGMGVLVDIVPNHVGVATPRANGWWWDLLTHGRDSSHALAFDVDWAFGDGRLRIPVVGDDDWSGRGGHIGNLALVDGELRYHDHRFPLAPGTLDPSFGDRVAAEERDVLSGREGRAAVSKGGGVSRSPDEVHARQHYELVSWRMADDELNYRRFFAVNTLAGLRVEDRDVFERSHVEIRRWCEEGLVDGLRVDHPDGLRHPAAYLDDLAGLSGGAYVLVEKILEFGEVLPREWATAGTTGYDALALIDRVLTDPAGEPPLDDLEARLRGGPVEWTGMVHDRKREVADGILRSEVRRIVRDLPPTSETDGMLEDAVAELLASFGVYRSYLPAGREHLDEAFADARAHRPDLAATFDALAPVLGDAYAPAALRFQQTSGMVMAKGVEDCSFYRFSRLTSLNEVGGDPSIFSVTTDAFHEAMAVRQRDWPHAMTALTTHDTKRGEDVRARITALAEVPGAWSEAVDRLLELAPVPDAGFGNLLWQAVIGAWSDDPDLRARLHGYAEKAMREAGDRTTWTAPDEAHEAAVHRAIDAAFDDQHVREVLSRVLARVVGPGWSNALAAKLVALTMPGVPDVYQGSELWEQSLVDPDNRRPVDHDVRRRLLATLASDDARSGSWGVADALDDPGTAKLAVTSAALRLRRDRPDLFTTYAPVPASGPAAGHVLAFDRGGAVTVATRLPVGLAARGGWGDTVLELPAGTWTDVVTARGVDSQRLGDVLERLPVALLVRES